MTRVYIKGDIGGPLHQIELFDGDTGKKLENIAEFIVTVGSSKVAEVKVRRCNESMFERMELVPQMATGGPVDPFAPWVGVESGPEVIVLPKDIAKGYVREAVRKAAKQLTCTECKGTGEVMLFAGPSPCSKGCVKP